MVVQVGPKYADVINPDLQDRRTRIRIDRFGKRYRLQNQQSSGNIDGIQPWTGIR